METFFIYLLKSAGVSTLFLCCYHLFLRKETFFNQNRIFLIVGLVASFVVPLLSYTKIIWLDPITIPVTSTITPNYSIASTDITIDWFSWLFYIYIIVVAILTTRLITQLLSLRKLIVQGNRIKKEEFYFIETIQDTAPFSFFNYIVYNPNHFSESELQAIITHEKIHATALHSLDIFFIHLVTIFQWFNPFIWAYKSSIGQNLEFIADKGVLKRNDNKRNYQYTLLKTNIGERNFSIANPFFNSLIKKRIVMMNKSKSSKKNLSKYATILPLLIGFIFLFNSNIVAKTKPGDSSTPPNIQSIQQDTDHRVYLITKETTDAEIASLSKEVANENGKLTIRKVKRNERGHITSLTISYKVPNSNVSASYNEVNGISPIYFGQNEDGAIYINTDENMKTNANGSNYFFNKGNSNAIVIKSDDAHGHNNKSKKHVWVSSDDKDIKTIEIENINGKEIIKVNGKEITKEEFEKMEGENAIHTKHITIKKSDGGHEDNIFILKDSDDDDDIEIIKKKSNSFFFVDSDDDQKQMYVLNGKETTKKEFEKLDPDEIESINVYKGEKAVKKYGKKAENGVIEIMTKEQE